MIAVVGLGFCLPGGLSRPDPLWRALSEKRDLIGPLPENRRTFFPAAKQPYPEQGGYLEDVDQFDAGFFGIKGLEACYMDPQQRRLMEVVWESFEDAAICPSKLSGEDVGVFVGAHAEDYREIAHNLKSEINAYWISGNNTSVLANRISHYYNFRGPSLTVNTACSSGLEAVRQAVDALRLGHCHAAVVAAANLILTPTITISANRAGILSPEARCRTFDAAADGFVRGEGVLAFILKPLDVALADGDRVYGVIRNSVVMHNGRTPSLTAPGLTAQRDLLVRAYRDLPLECLRFIETHGTATPLGDSVEIEALKAAFQTLNFQGRVALGSIKTNLGHLESAAGLVGLLKGLLCLQHQQIPGQLGFDRVHPLLRLQDSSFYIPRETEPWPSSGPRMFGVSSFGFGGTCNHVVVEEAPVREFATLPRTLLPFPFSARNEESLPKVVENALQALGPATDLHALSRTLVAGREALSFRMGTWAEDVDHLRAQLQAYLAGRGEGELWLAGSYLRGPRPRVTASPGDSRSWIAAWVRGAEVNAPFEQIYPRLSWPTYPFKRRSYWLPAGEQTET